MAPHNPAVHEVGLLTPELELLPNAQRQKPSAWYTPHGWLWEISSMIASICCTLALAILLHRVQDQPYEDWRFYIGLNPTISALTTVARGTLLLSVSACLSQGKWLHFVKQSRLHAMDVFDQASRGPLGALTIVLKAKTYLGLPTVAAVITVLALAIGPFTQQVVTYDQGSVDLASQRASFDYAHRYASGIFSFFSAYNSEDLSDTTENISQDMQGAIYRGLYQKQSSWTPSFSCPSDCKWSDAQIVLGFAGTCDNVTVATLATKKCVNPNPKSFLQHCRMTTPRGINIDTAYFDTVYQTFSVLNATMVKWPTTLTEQFSKPEVATYAFYQIQVQEGTAGVMKPIVGESVWQCSLNFTAYKYSRVSSTSNAFSIGEVERIPLERGTYDFRDEVLKFNQSGIPELSVSAVDVGGLQGFFRSTLFTGTSFLGESQPASQPGCSSAFMNSDAADITARLAKSMTDALQQNPASQQHTGSYTQAVTFVRVRWVWLILLGTLEAAGIILLVGTIIRARLEKDVLLWKSSQSALLFSHIDSDGLLVPPKSCVKELERETQTMTTQLLKG